MLIAAIDVGNTRTHLGLFARSSDGVRLVEMHHDLRKRRAPVSEAAYASVNPAKDRAVEKFIKAAWGVTPRKMGRDFPAAIRNATKKPAQTGPDRLANAAAAWHRWRKPVVIADLGTATTFNVVNARGAFIGGSISPGWRLQALALHMGTARLPDVQGTRRERPGRTTEEAIEAGLTWSIAGLLHEGFRNIARELKTRPRFVGTGGDAARFADVFDIVVPHLTLEGIAISHVLA